MRKLFSVFTFLISIQTFGVPLKILRFGMVGEPQSLNPALRGSSLENFVGSMINRSLSHYNRQSQPVPHVAVNIPNYLGNTLTFEIREDAKWDDGHSMVCEDFKTGFRAVNFVDYPDRVVKEIICDKNVPKKISYVFRNNKPNYYFYMTAPIPSHIENKILDDAKNELDYQKNTNYSQKPTMKGLYNGPYRVLKYQRGDYIQLERNPFFYGKKPFYDQIIVRFYTSHQSMIMGFKTHDIDVISRHGFSTESALQLKSVLEQEFPEFQMIESLSTGLIHLEFNLDSTLMKDLAVRQALSLVIDPKNISRIAESSKGLTGGIVFPQDAYFKADMEIPWYSIERKKAQKILLNAGYRKNSTGVLEKNGKAQLFTLSYNSESIDQDQLALYLAAQWKSLGFQVELKKSILKVLRGQFLKKRDFDVTLFRWSMPLQYLQPGLLTEKFIPLEGNQWIGNNYSGWRNKKVASLFSEADTHPEKAASNVAEIQKEMKAELPWLPLYFETIRTIVPKRIKNFALFPDWESENYEIENWEVGN